MLAALLNFRQFNTLEHIAQIVCNIGASYSVKIEKRRTAVYKCFRIGIQDKKEK